MLIQEAEDDFHGVRQPKDMVAVCCLFYLSLAWLSGFHASSE